MVAVVITVRCFSRAMVARGFSWQFAAPDHQAEAVSKYLGSTPGLPPPMSYNAKGRAYPDFAAVAVEGTS